MSDITDRTPDEVRLWWDRGILWINIAEGTLALNSSEALTLMKRLEQERKAIEEQARIDGVQLEYTPLVDPETLPTRIALRKLLEGP